jgi:hypothetical protein
MQQRAEILNSRASQRHTTPPQNTYAPTTPAVPDDGVARDDSSSNNIQLMYSSTQHPQYNIGADRQQWLEAATQAPTFPDNLNVVNVNGVDPSKAVAREQALLPWLLPPQYIWHLRSLDHAQRIDRYMEMTGFVAMLQANQDPRVAAQIWNLIHEASARLKEGELQWYNRFNLNAVNDAFQAQELQRWRTALQSGTMPKQVTREEIIRASQARSQTINGQPSQASMLPAPGYHHAIAKTTATGETASPSSRHSASIAAGFRPDTPVIGVSSPAHSHSHAGQMHPSSNSDEQEVQAKMARDNSITEQKKLHDEYQPVIEAWCKMQQMPSTARWYEKLHAWEAGGRRDVRPTPIENGLSSSPIAIAQTSGSDSPAEIVNIRHQWGDLKPHLRRHAQDKVKVPAWPVEDSLENSAKRPDGMYNCMHVNGNAKCCHDGLTEKNKKSAIGKQIRAFKDKVEEMVLKKDLHVSHKTWPNWHKKLKSDYPEEVVRVDALLAPIVGGKGLVHVQAPASAPAPAPAPAPPAIPQATPQQHVPQMMSTFNQRTLQALQPYPGQQTGHGSSTSQPFRQDIRQQSSMQHPVDAGTIASPQGQLQAEKQTEARTAFPNAQIQAPLHADTTSRPPLPASNHVASPDFALAGTSNPDRTMGRGGAAGVFSQQESQNEAAIASPVVPTAAQDIPQYAPSQSQTLSPGAAVSSSKRGDGQSTPQSTSREEELRRQQQQAPAQARNANQQQAGVQMPPSGAVTNHATETDYKHTETSASKSIDAVAPSAAPHMSSTTLSSSPDRSSSTVVASSPAAPRSGVDYQSIAGRMLQTLIKAEEPILLPGLKITREHVTNDMSGCLRKLTTALRSQAEASEETSQQYPREVGQVHAQEAFQAEAGDANHDATRSIFDSEADLNDFLNDARKDAWLNDPPFDLPIGFGDVDLAAMTDAAFAEESVPLQPEDELAPEPEEDPREGLNVPENWDIEGYWKVMYSEPDPKWAHQPAEYTLEEYSHFDLSRMPPSDLLDTLLRIRAEREEREAEERRVKGGAR